MDKLPADGAASQVPQTSQIQPTGPPDDRPINNNNRRYNHYHRQQHQQHQLNQPHYQQHNQHHQNHNNSHNNNHHQHHHNQAYQHQRNYYFYSSNYQRRGGNPAKGRDRRKGENKDDPSTCKDEDKAGTSNDPKTLQNFSKQNNEEALVNEKEHCDEASQNNENKSENKKSQHLQHQHQHHHHHQQQQSQHHRVNYNYNNRRPYYVQRTWDYPVHENSSRFEHGQNGRFRLSKDLREQRQRFYQNRYVSSNYIRSKKSNSIGEQQSTGPPASASELNNETPAPPVNDQSTSDQQTHSKNKYHSTQYNMEPGKFRGNRYTGNSNSNCNDADGAGGVDMRPPPLPRHRGYRRDHSNYVYTTDYQGIAIGDSKGHSNSNSTRRYRKSNQPRRTHHRSIDSNGESNDKVVSNRTQRENTSGGGNKCTASESGNIEQKINGQVEANKEQTGEVGDDEEEEEEEIISNGYDASSSDDSTEKDCPLCLEVLDSIESKFYPCSSCKFQICLFCLNRLKEDCISAESENTVHSCPGCRNPYPNNVDDESVFLDLSRKITQKSNQNSVTNGSTSKASEKGDKNVKQTSAKQSTNNRYSNLTCDTAGDALPPQEKPSHAKKSSNVKNAPEHPTQQPKSSESRKVKTLVEPATGQQAKADAGNGPPKKLTHSRGGGGSGSTAHGNERTGGGNWKDHRSTRSFSKASPNYDFNSNEKLKRHHNVSSRHTGHHHGYQNRNDSAKNAAHHEERVKSSRKGSIENGPAKVTVDTCPDSKGQVENGLYYENETGTKKDLVDLLSNIGLDPSRIHFQYSQKCESDS